ncbi:hypothetical protein RclHR1_00660009 [Rhizophagus clarus]|uniref:Tryptophan-rich sensory protein n=1 Tax=Rhizophagus clarus TaxID=94130 RepID=A0A2Z6S5J1_9GLOM|nr:hypothetical protein RclHR1_00660009 [Rhizophagus clarus]
MCGDSATTLRVANLISFALLTAVKGFTTFSDKVAENDFLLETYNSTQYTFTDVYILPKQYTFGIWGLIYILLAVFVFYQQWTESAKDMTIYGVSYHFCIAAILNIIWLIIIWFIQQNERILIIMDTLVITTLFLFLYFIYDNLENYPTNSIANQIFVHATFKIYLAWTFITLIINFWIAIPTLNTIIISSIILAYLGFMGLYFLDYRKEAEFFIPATIVWALVGIAVKQYEIWPILAVSAFSIGLITGGVLRLIYEIYQNYHDKNGGY